MTLDMGISDINKLLVGQRSFENRILGKSQKKKRKSLTPAQRLFIWEHPNLYGRKCHICGQKITKQSELQLDHKRAFVKKGKKLALAHAHCNRMKSSGSLGKIQKALGLKSRTKKKSVKRKIKRQNDFWGI